VQFTGYNFVSFVSRIKYLMRITRTHGIARRYFVVNGFDGALTMLGIIIGFTMSTADDLPLIINACLGAAIALAVSGVSSAWVSETAERRRELTELEGAMITDLEQSLHGEAVRWVPLLIGLVNGAAPLFISILILVPLWLVNAGVPLPLSPLFASITIAMTCIFLLGVLLGRIGGTSWLRSGVRTLSIALLTAALIFLFTGS
jgi:predicted membrane protein (TIGR00267 family)